MSEPSFLHLRLEKSGAVARIALARTEVHVNRLLLVLRSQRVDPGVVGDVQLLDDDV